MATAHADGGPSRGDAPTLSSDVIGIRALKQNASAAVALAASGRTLTVTDRGRAVAQLAPLPDSPAERLLAAALARPARRDWASLSAPLAAAPSIDGAPTRLSDDLVADRASERY